MTIPETTDLIGLAHVPRELTTLVDDDQGIPSYRGIYLMIADGKVPADLIEYIRGRYYVRRPNLPALAQILGVRLKRAPARLGVKAAAKPQDTVRSGSSRPAV
jgi:hypothetical protein